MTQLIPVSRRSFLQVLLNGLGGSTIAAIALPPDLLDSSARRLDSLDQNSFAGKLNSRFRLFYAPYQSAVMTLIAVTDLRVSSAQKGEIFSLLFETTAGQTFSQGTYLFQHKKLGTFNMFIVPASSNGISYRYEALFNRLQLA